MGGDIVLPLWAVILLVVLSLALVIDRVLIPSVRWYLRRRVNRVIDEINTRLDIEIRSFQSTRRQVLIDQLVYDEEVNEAVQAYALEHKMPREVALANVRRYAKEIVPSFNAFVYFRGAYWLAKKLSRLIYRVRVGFFDSDGLGTVDPRSTVVFTMNHRSNMDYVLVSFLAARKTTLSYAVGEWAKIWPLKPFIKSMGAFFVRRNSGNPLYRKVLERYVHMATRAGVCQAVFLEGGLSKDGATREPRLGFLDYMLRDFHPEHDRDIVFVPVGINYDRVVEDRSLVRRLNPNVVRRSKWFVIKTTCAFIIKHLLLSRRSRWRRFGYASVNFGEPVSARAYCSKHGVEFSKLEHEERFGEVGKLAEDLMKKIQNVIPVLPVPLMASVVLENRTLWKSELELKTSAVRKIEELGKLGAPISIASNTCEGVLSSAMTMLLARGFVSEENGLFQADPDALIILSYYANSIRHWR